MRLRHGRSGRRDVACYVLPGNIRNVVRETLPATSLRKIMIQTLEWTDKGVRFIDQTKLPTEEVYVNCKTHEQVADVIRNMVVLNEGSLLTEAMMPKDLKLFAETSAVPAANQNASRKVAIAAGPLKPLWQVEKEAILQALAEVGDDIPRAATLLEVSPSTLYRKLQHWRREDAPVAVV